jgi:acetylornithine/N-succinyldiaminopimelate aminotransferase
MLENNLAARVEKVGGYLQDKLAGLGSKYPLVTGCRGKGLLLAMTLSQDVADKIVLDCLENGLIVNNVRANAVRLAPPLTVENHEVDKALGIIENAVAKLS